jgi:hypothetical protein
MEPKVKNALHAAILKLLKPLVRILLRNGIPFKTFADLAKWMYVDIAHNEFGIMGKKQTDSRVSIITGLSRKEVRRIKNLELPGDEEAIYRYNRAARVIAGWVKDRRFLDSRGNPRTLAIEGDRPTFSDLVQIYGGDVPVRAVLDELMDVSAIRLLKSGKIKLQARAYLPAGDEPALMSILGTDVAYLIKTIDHNIIHKDDGRFFQRKVFYDNVPTEASKKFRLISADKAQKLLEILDRWLAEHDRDVNPAVKGSGRKKVGLGIYYFEEDLENDTPSAEDHGGKS